MAWYSPNAREENGLVRVSGFNEKAPGVDILGQDGSGKYCNSIISDTVWNFDIWEKNSLE